MTLADLRLDDTPITSRLLNSILLPEIPIEGGWSRALMPGTAEVLVEQTISLLDVFRESAAGGRYPGAVDRIALGDLSLEASNLGSISHLRGAPGRRLCDKLPFPPDSTPALAYWCGQGGRAARLLLLTSEFDLVAGTGGDKLTLPALSFAGIDIEPAALLGSPLVRPKADGTLLIVNLAERRSGISPSAT